MLLTWPGFTSHCVWIVTGVGKSFTALSVSDGMLCTDPAAIVTLRRLIRAEASVITWTGPGVAPACASASADPQPSASPVRRTGRPRRRAIMSVARRLGLLRDGAQ